MHGQQYLYKTKLQYILLCLLVGWIKALCFRESSPVMAPGTPQMADIEH